MLLILTVVATSVATAVSPVMRLPLDVTGDNEVAETTTGNRYSVRGKHGCNVPAVVGDGLRTDGYSTYVQIPLSNYNLSSETLTISFWTACQTYPMMNANEAVNRESAIISCLDDTGKKGFAFFIYSQGKYGFSCYINGEKKTLSPPALFPQYQWVHLCATIDGVNGLITLYRNGQQVASTTAKGNINLSNDMLYIGKSVKNMMMDQFHLETYNGIIDELHVYNEILSADDIRSLAQTEAKLDLNVPLSHFHNDLTRPRHHAMPASNWMNESHGMTFSNGRFHIFFQKNGNGPYMARLHWGHLTSADLCNWHEEPIAIVPGKGYDLKGCWSGCVFHDQQITNGLPFILYTGVDNARATINLATPLDSSLVLWNKSNLNPVINGTPSGYSADFRDPYFFRSGDNAYCIVGTAKNGVSSTSLHQYNAETGVFDYTGLPFFTGSDAGRCGSFFEMPTVTPMGDNRYLFTATPLGSDYGVRTIYFVGSINDDGTFYTSQATPLTVELPGLARRGYGLLSPTIFQKDGKTIAIGIVPDKLATSINHTVGWAHTLSLPREWSIDAQGELVQKPYEGLQNLRSSTQLNLEQQTLNGNLALDPVRGHEIEVEAVFTVAESAFGINILQNDDNGSACKIYYEPATGQFVVDMFRVARRANDTGTFDGVYRSELPKPVAQGENMKIHLFYDHSVLDIFINDRWATSIRVFPTNASADGVSLFAEGDTQLQSAQAWTMIPHPDDYEAFTALPEVQGSHTANDLRNTTAYKTLRDGRFIILRGDNIYTLQGQEIK